MPDLSPIRPRFPLYIVSKGRTEYPITIRALSHYRVPFHVIVEASEADAYQRVVDSFGSYGTVLVLDPAFQRDYDACTALTEGQSRGSGPARNFAWAHAESIGAEWHWTMDDNINGLWYYNRNRKMQAGDAAPFLLMEDFVGRYENVAMAGPNYFMFITRKASYPPFQLNTRVYSCNLIRTGLPFRWRGRYNEDTILSLDMLKAGWNTILFNAYLQWKMTSGVLPGGNQAELYASGTTNKSKMLVQEHPDVARLTYKFGRVHHHVDYKKFAGRRLVLSEDASPIASELTNPKPHPRTVTAHTRRIR